MGVRRNFQAILRWQRGGSSNPFRGKKGKSEKLPKEVLSNQASKGYVGVSQEEQKEGMCKEEKSKSVKLET